MEIEIRKQQRKSMAFKLTPSGPVVLIPTGLEEDDPIVQQFIERSLADLPSRGYRIPPLTSEAVQGMVVDWAGRLAVDVTRVQIRAMRNKWGSISTAGTLTLADELLHLPEDLLEYVIVHELLHLKFPDHRKGWRVSMSMYIPDWQERERQLQTVQLTQ